MLKKNRTFVKNIDAHSRKTHDDTTNENIEDYHNFSTNVTSKDCARGGAILFEWQFVIDMIVLYSFDDAIHDKSTYTLHNDSMYSRKSIGWI